MKTAARNRWINEPDLAAIFTHLQQEDEAIARLALLTGYRIDDICSSRLVDWNSGSVALQEKKTGKWRCIPNNSAIRGTVAEIRACTRDRREWGSHNPYLVPARKRSPDGSPGHVSRCTIWRAWRRAIRAADRIGMGYTLHSLRRCYAVREWRRTGSIEAVQRDLGHKYAGTTYAYLQDAIEALARAATVSGVLHVPG